MEEFVFLRSIVPGTSSDVSRRISLAAVAFGRLKDSIWNKRDIPKDLKVRLYKALIIPIAIYAAESWSLKIEDSRKLNTFEMRCLRCILGVTRRDRIRNVVIRERLNMTDSIIDTIQKRRLRWFGHIVRRPCTSYVNLSYKEDFTSSRPRGRPPKRWKDQIKEDTGLPIGTAERNALQRENWRGQVNMERARIRRGLRY